MTEFDSKKIEKTLIKERVVDVTGDFLLGRPHPRSLGLQSIRIKSITKWMNFFSLVLIFASFITLLNQDYHLWMVSAQGGGVQRIQAEVREIND